MNRQLFAAALLLGLLLRAAALPLPGTNDIVVWKIWSYVAATEGIGRMYGVGGSPPERRVVSYLGAETMVDYPPVALAELGLAGRAYRLAMHGGFPNTWPLQVAIKAPAVLADLGFLLLAYLTVRRLAGEARARWVVVACSLSPAIVLDAAVLGYLDPLFVLPAAGALIAAAARVPLAAGGLAAVALLTKPQAIVLMPAVVLAVWNADDGTPGARRFVLAVAGALVVIAAGILPVVGAGGWSNMLLALSRLGHHDMLSGNACNLWWLVGWVVRAYHSIGGLGVWGAFSAQTKILQISRFMEIGYPNPRLIGVALAGSAMLWGVWTARRARDPWLVCGAAAFLVHAYATLAAQVHENHLYAAVPLLALAAAGRPAFAPVFAAVSAIFAVNLNVFYGISEGIGYAIPRTMTPIDLTVLLSIANCAALVWHARVLSREAANPDHDPAAWVRRPLIGR